MSEWTSINLGNHCRIKTGKKDVNEGNPFGQFPFFTCSRDVSWSDEFSFETEAILIAGNGDVGNLHYYNGKFEAYQRTYVVDSFNININYIYHYLEGNLLKALEREKVGTSIPYIKLNHLSEFEIRLPVLKIEQQKIATILQTIDQTIEKTEALIEKYQQIKAGLMHDLFTRGITADGKLRPPREQAPELYQETPIGWIPKPWESTNLGKKLKTLPKNGFSPKEIDSWDELYVLGLSCLTKQGFLPVHLKNAPRKAILSGSKLKDGDFLISRANTPELVGLCGIYKDVGEDAIYPDLMMKLSLVNSLDNKFLELYLLSPPTRIRLTALAVGTSQSMVKLNSTSVRNFHIAFPTYEEQILIVIKMKPLIDQLHSLDSQLQKLKKQKSGLMHDLLTGKVPVTVNENESIHVD